MAKREVYLLLGLAVMAVSLASVIAEDCTESWQCDYWSECSLQGTKMRNCTELNHCNTTMDKPPLTRACGVNCTVESQCMPWNPCVNGKQTRICYQTSSCGAAEEKTLEWQPCTNASETSAPINLSADSGAENETNGDGENTEDSEENNLANTVDGCGGCSYSGQCYAVGERAQLENQSVYCDGYDKKLKAQKMRNLQGKLVVCTNHYECLSNVCSSGKCFDLDELLAKQAGFKARFGKLICKFKALFKPEGYEACLYKKFAMNETA